MGVENSWLDGLLADNIYSFSDDHSSQAKQLKDYEDAVIAKRLEELDEDEVKALQEEIARDDF